MPKPSPRRDILLGSLLLAIGIALSIFYYLNPPKEAASVLVRVVLPLALRIGPVVLGVGGILHGVWALAMSGPASRSQGPSRLLAWIKRNRRALVGVSTALFGVSFLVLTAISVRLPQPRGSHYVLRHELVRMTALVSGVMLLLGVMTILLPLVLNVLEGRSFVSLVSARHVRASKSGFLTVISVLSIAGVAVSSCALVSVVSIMGGFGQDLKRKILGNNAHITIDTQAKGGFDDWASVVERVRQVPGVAAATPVVSGEAMCSSTANTAGVMVRGVDPDTIGDVIELRKNIEVGKFDYMVEPQRLLRLAPEEVIGIGLGGEPFQRGPDLGLGSWSGGMPTLDPSLDGVLKPGLEGVAKPKPPRPGVVIGRELAKSLHVYVGDDISLISPLGDLGPMGVMPRVRRLKVAAIFYSGMYEYDATHVYVLLPVAQDLFSLGTNVSGVDVKALEGERADLVTPVVQAAVERPELRVRDWRELNKNLFSALKLERIATFIILSIAIAVASFCIICTLLLMVTEKGKEIGILKALGATDRAVMSLFMLEGIVIGAIGTAFGVATGVSLCLGLSWYGLRLDPDVYYIDRLPIAINWADYLMVAVCAIAICTIATIYPARAASKLRPVDALRYE